MKFLFDTHALIFWLLEPSKLGSKGRKMLSAADSAGLISVMSLLEIQFLTEIGRVELDFTEMLGFLNTESRISIISFTKEISMECHGLATRDPFDRVILATARQENVTLLSRDRWMKNNYKKVVW